MGRKWVLDVDKGISIKSSQACLPNWSFFDISDSNLDFDLLAGVRGVSGIKSVVFIQQILWNVKTKQIESHETENGRKSLVITVPSAVDFDTNETVYNKNLQILRLYRLQGRTWKDSESADWLSYPVIPESSQWQGV